MIIKIIKEIIPLYPAIEYFFYLRDIAADNAVRGECVGLASAQGHEGSGYCA
jgi:hypothetical protein